MSTIARMPMPERLEPKPTKHRLATKVRDYCYELYNAANGRFKSFLASVNNKDAITGNRLFDRHEAVGMIKAAAKDAKDGTVTGASDGDIYRYIVAFMRTNQIGLKIRRQGYKALTHQTPAE
jgi:hypothetical protein